MLFVFLSIDRPGHQTLRAEHLPQHREYLRMIAERIAFAGPLLPDEGSNVGGSLIVIDFANREEAQAWIDEEPYARAGLYESVSVRAFLNRWPQRAGVVSAAPT